MSRTKVSLPGGLVELIVTLLLVFGLGGTFLSSTMSVIFTILQYLGIIAVLGFIIYKLYSKSKSGSLTKTALYINIGCIFLALGVSWYIFPVVASEIVYQGIYLHIPHLIVASIGLMIAYFTYRSIDKGHRLALRIIYSCVALLFIIGGPLSVSYLTDWKTAEAFPFEKREKIVEIDPKAIRYTPLKVAFQEMIGGFSSSEFTLSGELTNPVKLADGSFGYVTPTIPDGAINTYLENNNGYVVYNDSVDVSNKDRIKRVDQDQKYGEGMEWLDNIWRHLYKADMFTQYTDVIYLQLDKTDLDKRMAVAPKIKYKWQFPFVLVPYWAGVTLVDSDGNVETLDVKMAQKDPRLQGVRIFPLELERKYTSTQIYDQGFGGAFYKREGKIEIPELPGDNQMPFYTAGIDGNDYFVTLTVPDGGSDAMFRIYYINAFTGKRSMYEFGTNSQTLGPISALRQAKSIPGYKWIEEDDKNGDGNFRIIEPTYLTKNDKVYLKFTIVPRENGRVTSSVVVDLTSRTIEEYSTRNEFFSWFLDGEVTVVDSFLEAMKMITKGTKMIEEGQKLLEKSKLEQ